MFMVKTYLDLYLFYFWPCHLACEILVSQPGIKSSLRSVKVQSVNHGTTTRLDF